MSRTVFIRSYGCQMNRYDSDRMSDALRADGFGATDRIEEADLIVLNTCHIREKAAEKVYSELGRVRQVKEARARAGRSTLVAVAGCVAQAEGAEIARRAQVVDVVVGPQAYHRLPELARRAGTGAGPVVDTEFAADDKFAALVRLAPVPRAAPTAFLTVQEGCDKFCTFCVVPYTRGVEISRPVAAVTAEARGLVAAGAKEITLLGQNVNAYHGADAGGAETSLGGLLFALAEIDGLERLRYTTSHPLDMDEELIAAHRDLGKLMPYLHLPVQSGSDRVLERMQRRHRAADYLAVVERVRRARPDIALSSDFIVGFPGETEEDFAATVALVGEVGYAQAFSFKYSARPGTPAAEMAGQVGEVAKIERLARLQALLGAQQDAFNAATVGRTLPVLFERPGRRAGQLTGRSPYLQAVHAEAPANLLGTIAEVEIAGAGANSLAGRLSRGAAARSGASAR